MLMAWFTENEALVYSYFLVVSWLGLIASAIFVLVYGIFVRHLTATGRHMLIFSVFIAGIFLDQIAVLMWNWSTSAWHIVALLILFTAVSLGMWHRVLLFIQEQVVFDFTAFKKRKGKKKRGNRIRVYNTREEDDDGDTR